MADFLLLITNEPHFYWRSTHYEQNERYRQKDNRNFISGLIYKNIY